MANADYYRCDHCNAIWSLDKRESSKPLSLLIELPAEHEQSRRRWFRARWWTWTRAHSAVVLEWEAI